MRTVLVAAAAIVATILGVSLSMLIFGPPQSGPSFAGESGVAALGGPFELVDHNGEVVDESVLAGKPSLLYFGYTFCPDYCPTELANMADAADVLSSKGVDIGLFFVTVDPERDTQEVLKDYVTAFHDDMIGLGGSLDQVAEAAKAYRVIYRRAENPDFPDGYVMDHTTFVYALNENGQFVTHFTANTPPDEIAERLTTALQERRS